MVNLQTVTAKDWNLAEVGPQTGFEDSQIEWIGKAFTEEGKKAVPSGGGGGGGDERQ
jgi:hypothetical protein